MGSRPQMIGGRSLSGAILAIFAIAVTAVLMGVGLDSSATFSDNVRLGRNELVAGTIDLSLGTSTTPVLVENLAPGDRSVLALELQNDGTLPMVVSAEVVDTVGADTVAEMQVQHWLGEQDCDGEAGPTEVGRLAPAESGTFCLAVGLPLTATNLSQGRTANFTIIVTGVHDVDAVQGDDQSESQQ